MAKLIRPKQFRKKKRYSQFCNEMHTICSRRTFLFYKGKLGPARIKLAIKSSWEVHSKPRWLGLYKILPLPILYCVWHKKGESGMRHILRKTLGKVVQSCA